MSKVSGNKKDFALIKDEGGSITIGYGFHIVPNSINAIWHEVVLYKKQVPNPTIEIIRDAVFEDIDKQTRQKVLTGFVWKGNNVWLSEENQRNFSEMQRLVSLNENVLPVRKKIGEDEHKMPVYYIFESKEDVDIFYSEMASFIHRCLEEGWKRKDEIDWCDYIEEMRELNLIKWS